jgi:hypothetical protein
MIFILFNNNSRLVWVLLKEKKRKIETYGLIIGNLIRNKDFGCKLYESFGELYMMVRVVE